MSKEKNELFRMSKEEDDISKEKSDILKEENDTSTKENDMLKEKNKVPTGKNEFWEWTKALLIAVGLAALIRYFIFTPIVVDGLSMMPTLESGDRMIVNKMADPDRFDIVVFHAPENKDYIKRVIGLPGDTVEYKGDILYINGEPQDEPYLAKYKSEATDGPLTPDFTLAEITGQEMVPEGEVFVLGDNRRFSKDGRHIGTVKIDEIVGETKFVYWPFDQIRLVD